MVTWGEGLRSVSSAQVEHWTTFCTRNRDTCNSPPLVSHISSCSSHDTTEKSRGRCRTQARLFPDALSDEVGQTKQRKKQCNSLHNTCSRMLFCGIENGSTGGPHSENNTLFSIKLSSYYCLFHINLISRIGSTCHGYGLVQIISLSLCQEC